MSIRILIILQLVMTASVTTAVVADDPPPPKSQEALVIRSSWDDLLNGVTTLDDWQQRRTAIRERYLDLLRDQHKPAKPPLDLEVHETQLIGDSYKRLLVSYNVEADERARAYIGIPRETSAKAPAVVALHGTHERGIEQTAGLIENPDQAFLNHLCRRGYVVIAPEHFVSGKRTPPEGAYDTGKFHVRHPNWTAAGKFTYEHSIAIDVLESLDEVDADRIGVMGHSLGGHGAIFLAAYDERVKAAVGNCSADFFRHNPDVEHWARDHWYVYFKHIRPTLMNGDLPPIDFHEIISLIAPRAYLDVSALNDGNPRVQRQRVLMLMKVAEVYDLVEKPDNFAFFVHNRGHTVPHESRALMYGFLDAHLKPPAATQTSLVPE